MQMSEVEFEAWKDSNNWLWEHLSRVAQGFKVASEAASKNLIECDESAFAAYRRTAIKGLTAYETLIEIIELEYDDMFTDGQLDKEEDSD